MDECLEDEIYEQDEDFESQEFAPPDLVSVSFPGCPHSFQWQRSRTLPASCPDCDMNVQSGGTCEDFPCCGHSYGECSFSPTQTSDYWHEWSRKREEAGYDRDDPDFYPEGMD